MEESRIKRINELYHKSQAEGLTEDEKRRNRRCSDRNMSQVSERICAAS